MTKTMKNMKSGNAATLNAEMEQLKEEAKQIKQQLATIEPLSVSLEQELIREASAIPNDTHPSSPVGGDESVAVLRLVNQDEFVSHLKKQRFLPADAEADSYNTVQMSQSPTSTSTCTSASTSTSTSASTSSVTAPGLNRMLDHMELSIKHGLVDMESGAKVAGSRFYFLTNEAAMLELALVNFTMQKLISRGFTPVLPPDLAR
jgi:seryl-tRNA synthetase